MLKAIKKDLMTMHELVFGTYEAKPRTLSTAFKTSNKLTPESRVTNAARACICTEI